MNIGNKAHNQPGRLRHATRGFFGLWAICVADHIGNERIGAESAQPTRCHHTKWVGSGLNNPRRHQRISWDSVRGATGRGVALDAAEALRVIS